VAKRPDSSPSSTLPGTPLDRKSSEHLDGLNGRDNRIEVLADLNRLESSGSLTAT
jgi:hypothetical protein